MHTKYLFYISSTLDDVKGERKELVRIISELGSIPVVMDAFDITREEDRRIIRKVIEECDYFINLTAYKGGVMVDTDSSLELEYSYAVKAGKPVLALLIGEKARWKESKKENTEAAAKALEVFKKKLRTHKHETWINQSDLRHKALELITREMNLNPGRGWVPSTEAIDPCVANELSRLIRENDVLKSQIRIDGADIIKKVREQIKHALKVLAANRIPLSFYYVDGKNWENPTVFRYLRLFKLLAPEFQTSKNTQDLSRFLGNILNPDLDKTVRKDFPTPTNTIKKIMADFSLLKLVKYTGSGDDGSWEMTEFGKEAYAAYRLRQLEKTLRDNAKNREEQTEKDLDKK